MSQKKKIKGKKTIKKISNLLDNITSIFFILIALFGFYSYGDRLYVYYNAQDKSILKYKPKLLDNGNIDDSVKLENSVAWLTIDNTNIDYPVMQGTDNSEYLNKDPFGKFSLSGSLFLDSRNASDFSDEYSLIYGHHMEKDTMFGALDEFKKEKYLKDHKKGTLIVGDHVYNIEIFACITASATDGIIFNPETSDSDSVITKIKTAKGAVIDNAVKTSGKNIIGLSTCQSSASDDRTIVFGVRYSERYS